MDQLPKIFSGSQPCAVERPAPALTFAGVRAGNVWFEAGPSRVFDGTSKTRTRGGTQQDLQQEQQQAETSTVSAS
jgi:hypothetical protein